MCEPVSMGIAAAATLASAGMSAYGSYQSGKSALKAAEYNNEVAEAQALHAQRKGSIAAADQKRDARELIAKQRAAAAANGGVVDSGSNLDLFTSTAMKGELNAARIQYNAGLESAAYNDQGALDLYEGKAAKNAGIYNATGSILGGVSSAAGTYSQYKYNTKLIKNP